MLATDEEQLGFWRRHTHLGAALCVVLPAIVIVRTLTLPASPHFVSILVLYGTVLVVAPLVLLVPVERVVAHPRGRLFFDVWEAVGVALVSSAVLLDGGAASPYVMVFYVLLAHAALAYPPAGMVLAGTGIVAAYLLTGVVGGGVSAPDLLQGALTLIVATGTCAFASYNHRLVYRRTADYARQITLLAERDGLTGCLNHRTFHQRLQAEALGVERDRPLSLLIVDVDDFKAVNDTYGHPAGDAVLARVGHVLTAVLRAEDAVGRLGGDEFALLLPGATLSEAAAVGERICVQVRRAAADFNVTVSVGVSVSTVHADGTALLAAADHALYRAKRAGRDCVAGSEVTAGANLVSDDVVPSQIAFSPATAVTSTRLGIDGSS